MLGCEAHRNLAQGIKPRRGIKRRGVMRAQAMQHPDAACMGGLNHPPQNAPPDSLPQPLGVTGQMPDMGMPGGTGAPKGASGHLDF